MRANYDDDEDAKRRRSTSDFQFNRSIRNKSHFLVKCRFICSIFVNKQKTSPKEKEKDNNEQNKVDRRSNQLNTVGERLVFIWDKGKGADEWIYFDEINSPWICSIVCVLFIDRKLLIRMSSRNSIFVWHRPEISVCFIETKENFRDKEEKYQNEQMMFDDFAPRKNAFVSIVVQIRRWNCWIHRVRNQNRSKEKSIICRRFVHQNSNEKIKIETKFRLEAQWLKQSEFVIVHQNNLVRHEKTNFRTEQNETTRKCLIFSLDYFSFCPTRSMIIIVLSRQRDVKRDRRFLFVYPVDLSTYVLNTTNIFLTH